MSIALNPINFFQIIHRIKCTDSQKKVIFCKKIIDFGHFRLRLKKIAKNEAKLIKIILINFDFNVQ